VRKPLKRVRVKGNGDQKRAAPVVRISGRKAVVISSDEEEFHGYESDGEEAGDVESEEAKHEEERENDVAATERKVPRGIIEKFLSKDAESRKYVVKFKGKLYLLM
jgi:hypothetical protein